MPYHVVRSYLAVVRCPNQFFFDRFQLGKAKSQGAAKLAAEYDLGAKMYLVRHMRGAASELGLRNRTESTRKGFNLAGMKGTTYMEFEPVYLSRNLDLHLV